MKKGKIELYRRWLICGVIIFLMACFVLYAKYRQQDLVEVLGLESWIGKYDFFEYADVPDWAPIMMDYKIDIYEDNYDYYADIVVSGHLTYYEIKAKVYGSGEWISLVMVEFYSEPIGIPIYSEGSVLLSFRKDGEGVLTYWGEIEPILYANEEPGKVYFEKVAAE